MKRPKLRIFSILFVSLLIVTSSGIVFGSWYLKRLEETVTAKFEGPKWRFPSKIYSDSYLLYSGINLRSDDLLEKLRRLGYHETQSPPKARGEYHFQPSRGLLDIYLNDFAYPTEQFKGFPVRVSLQGTVITKIETSATGQEVFSLELEPELITGRYDVADGRCRWTKRYLGKHDVFYKGFNEGKGIWGTWEISESDRTDQQRGGFHIWPEGMPDPTESHLTEAADLPIVETLEVPEEVAQPV